MEKGRAWDRWRCVRCVGCVGCVGCVNGDTPLRSRMKRNICIVVMNMTLARSCFGLSL